MEMLPLISLGWMLAFAGPLAVPIWSGSLPPLESVRGNLCNLAAVKKLGQSRHLLVRAGSGHRFESIDRLSTGERVYTCSNRGEWIGVAYSTPNVRCGGPGPVGLDIRRTKSCRSGWVHRDWIEVLAGWPGSLGQ